MNDYGPVFRTMLDYAKAALNGGDAVDGERRAKAIFALVRAGRELA